MAVPPSQSTRFDALTGRLGRGIGQQLGQTWRSASLAVLSLLLGYWLGQNLTALWLLAAPGGRPVAVLVLLVTLEILVRLRTRWVKGDPGLGWIVVDNLRIGLSYAVVLEAFKLGS